MQRVLVIGSLNLDLVISVDRMVGEGETIFGNNLAQLVGGKGANQASSSVLQGVPTTMWGMLGSDSFASFIESSIDKLNINKEISYSHKPTGTAIIETDAQGKNRIIVLAGANGDFSVAQAKEKIGLLETHDIVLMQFEIPLETIEYIATQAKKLGKTVIVNPAPALAISPNLLKNIDYLVPNEHELGLISGLPTNTKDEIEQASKALLDKGVANLIVTLGQNGVYYRGLNEAYYLDAYKVEPKDTTGAGDAFAGGLAAALARGLNIKEAISHANKVAALSVTKVGAFASAATFAEASQL